MFGQWGSIGCLVAEEGGKGGHQGREYKMIRSQHRSSETQYLFKNYNYNVHKFQFEIFGQWGSISFLVAEEGGKGGHQEGAVHNDL